jgi:hypothetical protein
MPTLLSALAVGGQGFSLSGAFPAPLRSPYRQHHRSPTPLEDFDQRRRPPLKSLALFVGIVVKIVVLAANVAGGMVQDPITHLFRNAKLGKPSPHSSPQVMRSGRFGSPSPRRRHVACQSAPEVLHRLR